jgi:hypothetical protein
MSSAVETSLIVRERSERDESKRFFDLARNDKMGRFSCTPNSAGSMRPGNEENNAAR